MAPMQSTSGPDEPFTPSANTNDTPEEVTPSTSNKKKRKSAAGRKLMRWDPSVDQHVLLVIDYVCAREGVAVPWDLIAAEIQPWMTGEAIKQHLVKLRSAREHAKLAVPPKIERSVRRKAALKGSAVSTPTRGDGDDDDDDDQSGRSLLFVPSSKKKTRTKTPKTGGSTKTPKTPKSNQKVQDNEDDEEVVTPSKSKKSASKSNNVNDDDYETPSKKVKTNSLRARAIVNYKEQLEDEDGDDDEDTEDNLLAKPEPFDDDDVFEPDFDEDEGEVSQPTQAFRKPTVPEAETSGAVKQEQSKLALRPTSDHIMLTLNRASSSTIQGMNTAASSPFQTRMSGETAMPSQKNFSRPFSGTGDSHYNTTSSSSATNNGAVPAFTAGGHNTSGNAFRVPPANYIGSTAGSQEPPFFGNTDSATTGNYTFSDVDSLRRFNQQREYEDRMRAMHQSNARRNPHGDGNDSSSIPPSSYSTNNNGLYGYGMANNMGNSAGNNAGNNTGNSIMGNGVGRNMISGTGSGTNSRASAGMGNGLSMSVGTSYDNSYGNGYINNYGSGYDSGFGNGYGDTYGGMSDGLGYGNDMGMHLGSEFDNLFAADTSGMNMGFVTDQSAPRHVTAAPGGMGNLQNSIPYESLAAGTYTTMQPQNGLHDDDDIFSTSQGRQSFSSGNDESQDQSLSSQADTQPKDEFPSLDDFIDYDAAQ
ncbi:hypothetical protein MBLNU230_g2217t1 [Neophaeotheca triangularis]